MKCLSEDYLPVVSMGLSVFSPSQLPLSSWDPNTAFSSISDNRPTLLDLQKKKRHTYGTTSLCQHRFKQGTTFSKPSKQAWIKHKAQTGSEAPFHRASPPLRQVGGGHTGFLEVRHGSGVIQSAGKAESSVQLPLRNKKHMLGSDIWSDCLQ